MAEAMGHLEEGLLSQLHFSVQQQVGLMFGSEQPCKL